jgi:hypothetical protein
MPITLSLTIMPLKYCIHIIFKSSNTIILLALAIEQDTSWANVKRWREIFPCNLFSLFLLYASDVSPFFFDSTGLEFALV